MVKIVIGHRKLLQLVVGVLIKLLHALQLLLEVERLLPLLVQFLGQVLVLRLEITVLLFQLLMLLL